MSLSFNLLPAVPSPNSLVESAHVDFHGSCFGKENRGSKDIHCVNQPWKELVSNPQMIGGWGGDLP